MHVIKCLFVLSHVQKSSIASMFGIYQLEYKRHSLKASTSIALLCQSSSTLHLGRDTCLCSFHPVQDESDAVYNTVGPRSVDESQLLPEKFAIAQNTTMGKELSKDLGPTVSKQTV